MDRPLARSTPSGVVLLLTLLATASPALAAETSGSVHAWSDRARGIESANVTAVTMAPDRPGVVWVGAGGALYRSRDGGESWDRLFVVRGIGAFARLEDETEAVEIDELALRDAAEELAEEVRQRTIDDLAPEVGTELAEELADEAAESLVEELLADPDLEAVDELDRRRLQERYGLDPEDIDELERRRREEREEFVVEPEDRINRIDVVDGGRVLVGTTAGLFISVDDGETFRQVNVGLGEEGRRVPAVRWDRAEPRRVLAGTEDGLWVSEDEGLTFTRATGVVDRGEVRDIGVSRHSPDVVLAATERGLLRSDDGGMSFREVWSPIDEDLADVRAVDFDARVAGRVYAGTSGGLLLSTDGGESFGRVDPPGLTTRVVNDLRCWPFRAGAPVVATPAGVFASRDGAQSFSESYPGLPARDVVGVAPVPHAFPEIFVATPSGLFSWEEVPDVVPRVEWLDEVMHRAPPLAEIAHAALRFAKMESTWFQDAHRRARRAWMLPQLHGMVRIVDNSKERHILQSGVPPRRQIDLDDDLRWEIRARWDLDGAIHESQSLAVSTNWHRVRRERARLLDRVNASYSAWVSLSVRAIQVEPRDLREASFLALQIAEAEAHLDALTGGFFSQSLKAPDPM